MLKAMYTVSIVPMTARIGIQDNSCSPQKPEVKREKSKQNTYLVSSLDHSLLALHLDVLLLLGVGQSEWHTE